MIILIIIILIIIYLLVMQKNELFNNTNKNKWIVLLTACVNPKQIDKSNENDNIIINYRINLYSNVIYKWLNYTNLPIYVIESSGYNFNHISHERLKVISFIDEPKENSSIAEASSILHALNNIKEENYTHILKVTCKYYLNDIENILNELPDGYDMYTQQRKYEEEEMHNTEYYGIKKELMYDFATVGENLMETQMHFFRQDKKTMDFPVQFANYIPRNNGQVLDPL